MQYSLLDDNETAGLRIVLMSLTHLPPCLGSRANCVEGGSVRGWAWSVDLIVGLSAVGGFWWQRI